MNILWIEDFGGSKEGDSFLLDQMFGGISKSFLKDWNIDDSYVEEPQNLENFCVRQGLPIKITLVKEINAFFKLKASESDYKTRFDLVVIDIDLTKVEHSIDANSLPKGFSPNDLYKKEGLYIYNDLIRSGVPDENICFMTGEALSTLDEFKSMCRSALIEEPTSFEKSEQGYEKFREWIQERYDNSYLNLRRGVIDGIEYLQQNIDFFRFDRFGRDESRVLLKDTVGDYFSTLAFLLPLREPKNSGGQLVLFLRALAHIWEDNTDPQQLRRGCIDDSLAITFGYMLKQLRNYSAHQSHIGLPSSEDCAFFFIANMRAIFSLSKEILPFERYLLKLFPVVEVHTNVMKTQIVDNYFELKQSLVGLLKKQNKDKRSKKFFDAIYFKDILKNLNMANYEGNTSKFFLKQIERMLWLNDCSIESEVKKASNGVVTIAYKINPRLNKLDNSPFIREFSKRTFGYCFK